MFDQGFFSTKVGHAALVSVMAMVAFTVFAHMQTDVANAEVILSVATVGELA